MGSRRVFVGTKRIALLFVVLFSCVFVCVGSALAVDKVTVTQTVNVSAADQYESGSANVSAVPGEGKNGQLKIEVTNTSSQYLNVFMTIPNSQDGDLQFVDTSTDEQSQVIPSGETAIFIIENNGSYAKSYYVGYEWYSVESAKGAVSGGMDFDSAVTLPIVGSEKDTFTGTDNSKASGEFFAIDVNKESVFTIEPKNDSVFRMYDPDRDNMRGDSKWTSGSRVLTLEPGKYYLALKADNGNTDYTVDIQLRDYIPATNISVTPVTKLPGTLTIGSSKNYEYKVSLTPANTDDRVRNTDGTYGTSFTAKGTFKPSAVGRQVAVNAAVYHVSKYFDEYVGYEARTDLDSSVYVNVAPQAPSKSYMKVKATYKDIQFSLTSGNGYVPYDSIKIQQKSGKTWKTIGTWFNKVGTPDTIKVKKLKASTKYSFRYIGVKSGISTNPSATVSVKTGPKGKVKIVSAKTSNVRYVKVPKKWHSGYWDLNNHWHSGYYTGGYTLTKYKLTIKLNKKLKGAAYIHTEGSVVKNGSTITVNASRKGKCKGKKQTLYVHPTSAKNNGWGIKVKGSYTIK